MSKTIQILCFLTINSESNGFGSKLSIHSFYSILCDTVIFSTILSSHTLQVESVSFHLTLYKSWLEKVSVVKEINNDRAEL